MTEEELFKVYIKREAEDSFKCKKVLYKWETDKHSYIDGFRDGATFGYSKANEWHYPSKGEYPKECENVLCYCKCRTEIKFYSTGHTIIGGDNKIRWWSSDRSEKLKVYAWKEITPPKEIEEK